MADPTRALKVTAGTIYDRHGGARTPGLVTRAWVDAEAEARDVLRALAEAGWSILPTARHPTAEPATPAAAAGTDVRGRREGRTGRPAAGRPSRWAGGTASPTRSTPWLT